MPTYLQRKKSNFKIVFLVIRHFLQVDHCSIASAPEFIKIWPHVSVLLSTPPQQTEVKT